MFLLFKFGKGFRYGKGFYWLRFFFFFLLRVSARFLLVNILVWLRVGEGMGKIFLG